MEPEEKHLRTQIFLSLLTLFLTPILSATVVYFQLTQEHRYRGLDRADLRYERRLDRKLDLEKKVQELVGEVLNLRTQIAYYHYRFGLIIVANRGAPDFKAPDVVDTLRLREGAYDRYFQCDAELNATLASVKHFFGPAVNSAIEAFKRADGVVMPPDIQAMMKSVESIWKKQPKEPFVILEFADHALTPHLKRALEATSQSPYATAARHVATAVSEEVAADTGLYPNILGQQ